MKVLNEWNGLGLAMLFHFSIAMAVAPTVAGKPTTPASLDGHEVGIN
jgi:hypothetical protein